MAKGTLWVIFHPKTLLADYQRRGMDICELVGANDRLVRENTRLKESNRALRKVNKSKKKLREEIAQLKAERLAEEEQ